MRLSRSLLVLAAALMGSTTTLAAQGTSVGRVPIPFRTYVGLNPTIIPFDFGAVELESGIAQGMTIGGVASYSDFDGDHWTTGDVKFRYYPGEVVLRGFSIGLTAGYLRLSKNSGELGTRETLRAPTLGVITDYNWLLGGTRRFVVGTGLGAKRILAGESRRDAVDIGKAYVTARFIVGLAF